VRRQFLKSDSVGFRKRRVIKAFGDDDVHDGQGEGSVGSGPDQQDFIRLSSCFRAAHINRNDFGTPTPSRDDVAGCIGLTGDV
jgi:hypothetical protein